jgi:hypothetical protein
MIEIPVKRIVAAMCNRCGNEGDSKKTNLCWPCNHVWLKGGKVKPLKEWALDGD